MIDQLQEILKHERKHFNFYLQASMEIIGYERLFLKPLFEKEMNSELEHIKLFGDKIVSLGRTPTRVSYSFELGTSGKEMLIKAIEMEKEILTIYHKTYAEAEKYAIDNNDMSIVLLLEENIEHTTADVEEMEKILIGL